MYSAHESSRLLCLLRHPPPHRGGGVTLNYHYDAYPRGMNTVTHIMYEDLSWEKLGLHYSAVYLHSWSRYFKIMFKFTFVLLCDSGPRHYNSAQYCYGLRLYLTYSRIRRWKNRKGKGFVNFYFFLFLSDPT